MGAIGSSGPDPSSCTTRATPCPSS
jgi:hypothetical protein